MMEVWGIIFLAVVAPIWIIAHYVTRNRQNRGLTPEDEKMMAEVWEAAKRMEERVVTLERILNDRTPSWRKSA